jgi:transposase-like protein
MVCLSSANTLSYQKKQKFSTQILGHSFGCSSYFLAFKISVMQQSPITCIKCLPSDMRCVDDNARPTQCCVKNGRTSAGIQRCRCNRCRKTVVQQYAYRAYCASTNPWITRLLTEGCSIRSIVRLLAISATTVTKRIPYIAKSIAKPAIALYKEYEIDELCTFCKSKDRPFWIVSALQRDRGPWWILPSAAAH